jgi:hypothetical protein
VRNGSNLGEAFPNEANGQHRVPQHDVNNLSGSASRRGEFGSICLSEIAKALHAFHCVCVLNLNSCKEKPKPFLDLAVHGRLEGGRSTPDDVALSMS